PVGHGPVAERSGAPHPVRPQFRPALAAGTTPRGTRRFAGALLAGTPAEVGRPPAPSLVEAASPGTPGARLPDAVVDHGPHRRSHRAGVRSALPSRSCRSADASPEVEPPETRNARRRARRRGHRALEAEGLASGKKNARRLGAHLVFADESGFLLAPLVVRTWAPRGCTPVVRCRQGRRDKISVIAGISVSPERHRLGLYYLLFYDNIGQEEVCAFLRALLRQLRGPLIVLLDNSSTHQGEPIEKLRARHPRLHVEHFPSYSPELNPEEGKCSTWRRGCRARSFSIGSP